MEEDTSLLGFTATGCPPGYAPQVTQPCATTLVEYVSEEFDGECLEFWYTPGAATVHCSAANDCCGSSYDFNEEEVRRLYNLLGNWLDARE